MFRGGLHPGTKTPVRCTGAGAAASVMIIDTVLLTDRSYERHYTWGGEVDQ